MMKLVGDLLKKAEKATSKEELRDTILAAGVELNDEEIDAVSGGVIYEAPVVIPPCLRDTTTGGK